MKQMPQKKMTSQYHVSESLFTSSIRKDRRQSVAFSASRNTCWRRKRSFLTSSTRSSSNSSFTTPEPPIGKCENEVNDLENERVREQIAQLPIKDVIEDCLRVLFENDENNDLILQAPPGAGKTTALPLAMMCSRLGKRWCCKGGGKILVLEPRRVAARAAATRMASILNEKVGETVGYQVRFERLVSSKTQIEVVTEGVLKNRLAKDPSLKGVSCVVFDEFHERNLDADLSLALVLRAKSKFGRGKDLKVCVMSATLGDVAVRCQELMRKTLRRKEDEEEYFYYDAPIVQSEGKSFSVETIYVGGGGINGAYNDTEEVAVKTVQKALSDTPNGGNILVFLPGAAEIRRVVKSLKDRLGDSHFEILPLYGALPTNEQNYALTRSNTPAKRRVVVSTPIAESSLTVPGVTIVVDSGLRRAPKYDHSKGMTRLTTERVSISSAD